MKYSFIIIFINLIPIFHPKLFYSLSTVAEENIKIDKETLTQDYINYEPESNYTLDTGDKLNIIVSRAYPELNQTLIIDGEGTINLTKIRRKFVRGTTIDELTDLLNTAYGEYIKFPEVEISIEMYRPISFFISGEVELPGYHKLEGAYATTTYQNDFPSEGITDSSASTINYVFPRVFDAIRKSGGVTEFSDLSKVEIIRYKTLSKGGGKIKATLDLKKLILFGDNSQNIRIYDGDSIKISKSKIPNKDLFIKSVNSGLNSKFNNVLVTGNVNLPGNIFLNRTGSLNDAIARAGGLKTLRGKIQFIRFNNDGSVDKRIIKYSKNNKRDTFNNPNLKNGDVIFVGKSGLANASEVITEVTKPFTGIYSAYSLIKVIGE